MNSVLQDEPTTFALELLEEASGLRGFRVWGFWAKEGYRAGPGLT